MNGSLRLEQTLVDLRSEQDALCFWKGQQRQLLFPITCRGGLSALFQGRCGFLNQCMKFLEGGQPGFTFQCVAQWFGIDVCQPGYLVLVLFRNFNHLGIVPCQIFLAVGCRRDQQPCDGQMVLSRSMRCCRSVVLRSGLCSTLSTTLPSF
jgi:hypothetical protein